ncbi:MAG: hypothetical protein ACRELB_05840 [Polyangiaceae bacterium]
MRLVLAAWIGVVLGAGGCSRSSIVGLYCEGGVRDTGREEPRRYEPLGGECLDVTADKPDADPTTIGSAAWSSDYPPHLAVRSAGKDAYTLHRDGEQVGTMRRDESWLRVVFSKVPPGSRTRVGNTYALRSDAPGVLF